jgi:(2R)-ethylmalonyl-CoA mutase
VLDMGGVVAAVDNAYMKQQLVESNTARVRAIESGERTVVGVNEFTETERSPLTESGADPILVVDRSAERDQIERLEAFRRKRNDAEVESARRNLRDVLKAGDNVMPASIRAAHAGVTTGEWADTLRELFGEYRAPTGVGAGHVRLATEAGERLRKQVDETSQKLGRRLKLLVGKPGLDGHSNGAEQIAVAARDAGMEVVYEGIRLTPSEIASSARDEGVHVIGLSLLSGSHGILVHDILERLSGLGLGDIPVVVGGIIPESDAAELRQAGVRRVYTPKDFDLTRIMGEIAELASESHAG